jgi:hypothetical protein
MGERAGVLYEGLREAEWLSQIEAKCHSVAEPLGEPSRRLPKSR